MAVLRIGATRYAGEYKFDDERAFSTLEWEWVIKFSGYMPLTLYQGFESVDPRLFCALGVIVLHRNGKIAREDAVATYELLSDEPFDFDTTITLVGDEKKTEEEPVPLATEQGGQ